MAVAEDYARALTAAGIIHYPFVTPNFAPANRQFIFENEDLTGAIFAAQVRLSPDASGAALLDLTCSAVLVGADTWLTISASEAGIEGLPAPAELGRAALFYWDCDMTPVDDVKSKIFAGEFVRLAGVTQ